MTNMDSSLEDTSINRTAGTLQILSTYNVLKDMSKTEQMGYSIVNRTPTLTVEPL